MTSGANSLISVVLKVEMVVYYTEETQNIRDGLPWILFRQALGGKGLYRTKTGIICALFILSVVFRTPERPRRMDPVVVNPATSFFLLENT